jgi:dienelactone hydrolase
LSTYRVVIHQALILCLGAVLLQAQFPLEDERASVTPGPNTHFQTRNYASLGEWRTRRAALRRQILISAGLYPLPPRTPLNPRRFDRLTFQGYTVEKVWLETIPGYYVGGNLYLPLVIRGKVPAVLIPHGHWKHGRTEDTDSYSVPRLAVNLARQGFVAFTWDMVGYNDTCQTPHAFGKSPAEMLWAFGPLNLQLWNSIRALDFIQSLKEVDDSRIGVTGASGGATQTILLAAVDRRVRVSAPVAMVSAYFQGDSPCENAPGLRIDTNNVEIAALIAPRPQLLVSATGDWTRHSPVEEFPAIQRVYALYNHAENVQSVQIHARHNYNGKSREAVYRFLQHWLKGVSNPDPEPEVSIGPLTAEALLIQPARSLPAGALDEPGIFAKWRERAVLRTAALGNDALRRRLALTMGVSWPTAVSSMKIGDTLVLRYNGHVENIPVTWIAGDAKHVAVVVDPGGARAGLRSQQARVLLKEGYSLLLPDVFRSGRADEPRHEGGHFFLTYNRSDDACRVQDILTTLAYAQSLTTAQIRLVGLEHAALWVTFAAAVVPMRVTLDADIGRYLGSDHEFAQDFFVPGIQYAGGLAVAKRLAPPAVQPALAR